MSKSERALKAFLAAVDSERLLVDTLPDANGVVVCVTPFRQFPLGYTMSLNCAKRNFERTLLVADDRSFGASNKSGPSLQSTVLFARVEKLKTQTVR